MGDDNPSRERKNNPPIKSGAALNPEQQKLAECSGVQQHQEKMQDPRLAEQNTELFNLQREKELLQKIIEDYTERARMFNCSNCSASLTDKRPESTLCGHVFCSECCNRVIRPTKICPTCLWPVDTEKMHRIYNF